MHVGFLQAYFARADVGGGELHTERLAEALMARGHEVTIFTDEPRDRREGIDHLDVREYPTPLKVNPLNELALAREAWDDMVVCDVVTLTDDSAFRAVDLPVPTVMVFHIVWHGWVERYRPLASVLRTKPQALLYRWMERRIGQRVDRIVSISPNIAEDIALIGDLGGKTVHIPNGVDIDRFSPSIGKADEFTVHFQGRLVGMKNPGYLIEAAEVSAEDWHVTFGGDGPLREPLENRVREYGLTDRVEFLGYVPDEELPAAYARSHVYALPSDYEGMPLTVLEAAAAGTAVLVSDRAATDFVTDDIGWVVDRDPNSIADLIDELARNPDRALERGVNARAAAEGYSWDRIAERYEELYLDLIAEESTGAGSEGHGTERKL